MDLYVIKAHQHFHRLRRLYERGASADDEVLHHHRELTQVMHSAESDAASATAARVRLRRLMDKANAMLDEMKDRQPRLGREPD
jgi:hypothetical protein